MTDKIYLLEYKPRIEYTLTKHAKYRLRQRFHAKTLGNIYNKDLMHITSQSKRRKVYYYSLYKYGTLW